MSILKHQIIQEKVFQQSLHNPFTLIFHLNPITAKELTVLKKTLYSKNIRNSHQLIPLRFFDKLQYVSNVHLSEQNIVASQLERSYSGVQESFLTNLKYMGGSSCVFFCETKEEVANILLTIKESPSTAKSYFNLGIIISKKDNLDRISNLTFLSSYSMEVFLKTNFSIYNEFLVLLDSNSMSQNIDRILSLNRELLQLNQAHLVQILSFYSEKLRTAG